MPGTRGRSIAAAAGFPVRIVLAAILAVAITAGAWAIGASIQGDEPGSTATPVPVSEGGPTARPSATMTSTDTPAASPSALASASVSPAASATPAGSITHVVAPGETLTGLALRYYGDDQRWGEIYDANRERIPNPDNIRVGTELIIPPP